MHRARLLMQYCECSSLFSNFMPDTGRLKFLRIPEGTADVRIETGVREGDEITVYYDPMIAKVIVRGDNRLASLQLLDSALRDFNVVGVRTNIPLLRRILAEESFKEGMVDTGFIKTNESKLLVPMRPAPSEAALGAVLKILHSARKSSSNQPARAITHPDDRCRVNWTGTMGESRWIFDFYTRLYHCEAKERRPAV